MAHWTSDDGLPQNTIIAITQSTDGYIWITTREGTVRFDGVKFESPEREFAEHVLVALPDEKGGVWVGWNDVLAKYENGHMERYPCTNDLSEHRLGWFAAEGGGLWIDGPEHLLLFRDGKVVKKVKQESTVFKTGTDVTCKDAKGRLWVRKEGHFDCFDPATGTFRSDTEILGRACANERFISDNRDGFWIASPGALTHWTSGKWVGYDLNRDAGLTSCPGIFAERSGRVWLNCLEGWLLVLDDGKFFNVRLDSNISGNDIRCFFEDRDGNIWLGTGRTGVICLIRKAVRVYTRKDGLPGEDVLSVCPAQAGGVWIGTRGGLSLLKDGRFTNYDWDGERFGKSVENLAESSDGKLWMSFPRKGLFCLASNQPTQFKLPGSERNNFGIRSLLANEDKIWVGTKEGPMAFLDGIRLVGPSEGFSESETTLITAAKDGAIWVGSEQNGIRVYREGKFHRFGMDANLSSGGAWPLSADDHSSAWVGTSKGLMRCKEGRFLGPIRTENGLAENVIFSMLRDEFGRFWMGSRQGILCVDGNELERVASGRTNALACARFGIAEGLENAECNSGACKTPDGSLIFATLKGLAVIQPSRLRDFKPPPVTITDVMLDHDLVCRGGSFKDAYVKQKGRDGDPAMAIFPAGRANVLEVRFTLPDFFDSKKVAFKYRLNGLDKDWHQTGQRREALYTNLRPGSYRFEVLGCNHLGVWTAASSSFSFVLEPHFYETWTFYLLTGAGILGFGWGLHLWRLRYITRVEGLKQDLALERERLRIAHDIHDDVGSRLLQLSVLGELVQRNLEEPKQARPHLDKLNQTSKEIFRAMDEIVWTVNPRQDSVEGLAFYIREYATEFLTPAGIHCRFNFPAAIPQQPLKAEVRHHLFLLVKEALNNVLKHAKATEVWIRLRLQDGMLTLIFEDNGCGFDGPRESQNLNGNGLNSMRNRIEELRGQMHLESQPGQGTHVTFTLTLQP